MNANVAAIMVMTAFASTYAALFVKLPPKKRYPYRLIKRR